MAKYQLRSRGIIGLITSGLALLMCSSALADSGAPPPPPIRTLDNNGVDLLSQTLTLNLPSISTAGISWQPVGMGRQDNLVGAFEDDNASFEGTSVDLSKLGGRQVTMSCTSNVVGVGTCTLTKGDGTQITYDKTMRSNFGIIANTGVVTKIVKPDGEILTYNYISIGPYPYGQTMLYSQALLSVSSSLGWMVRYSGGNPMYFTKVYILNTSVDYCDPVSTADCAAADSATWPTITVNGGFIDALGNKTLFSNYVSWTGPSNYFYALSSITTPSGVSIVGTLDPNDGYKVISLTRGSSVWHYVNPKPYGGTDDRTTVSDPLGNTQLLTHEIATTYLDNHRPLSFQDELGRITKYVYANNTMGATRVISPEATYSGTTVTGGYTDYVYDDRNNITSVTVVPKGGGTPLVTTVNYSASPCANIKTCNKPNSIVDPRGNQTDYTYDPNHGGVLTETGPADSAGVRPQKRYEYSLLYPQIKNSANVPVNSTPVWRLTKTSVCATAISTNPASCVGTPSETITEYEYNTPNLLLTKTTARAGGSNVSLPYSSSNLWQSTSYGYDSNGRQVWVDGPRTDVDDKSYTTYDVLGRPVFEIGVDPDGAGGLSRAIVKHNYDIDGRDYLVQTGTGNTITFSAGIPTGVSDFTLVNFKRSTYDASTGLLIKTEVGQP